MPLMIELKNNERSIINGAVIESASGNVKLYIHNQANILRFREIMPESEAKTPASRIYYTLQCAYIFSEGREDYLLTLDKFLVDYLVAAPSSASIVNEITKLVSKGQLYKGLKMARDLLEHEAKLLEEYQTNLRKGEAKVSRPAVEGDSIANILSEVEDS